MSSFAEGNLLCVPRRSLPPAQDYDQHDYYHRDDDEEVDPPAQERSRALKGNGGQVESLIAHVVTLFLRSFAYCSFVQRQRSSIWVGFSGLPRLAIGYPAGA